MEIKSKDESITELTNQISVLEKESDMKDTSVQVDHLKCDICDGKKNFNKTVRKLKNSLEASIKHNEKLQEDIQKEKTEIIRLETHQNVLHKDLDMIMKLRK